ncbi:hypothetical protein PF007_g15846 [Phytophthora fragariae]|uniref:HTH psq-type domain-containing protein n=1 Tax=Phytophthora fragariae TaxID=53985 RepID=A0A6A3RSM0_9STRA|nr:hypothetical protein PF009_g13382 [Phytophthora fragariae]KAE9099531.1 hypothetical protein PF007_g15846 [Phytophthora fragariae]KAE9300639.1 hypothetical protein PF001_g14847 [Phytophthora fragariae]
MREPAETPSEPPQFQPLLPPQFQPLLPPQFQPSALELVRPPFFEPPPDDAAQQHAEETAIASLIEEVYTHPKQRRMHYSMKQKRHALLATEGLSQREAARAQKIPRGTVSGWRKAKEDIFAFNGSEKTLSRAPGRPESIPFSEDLITFMKDVRRESQPLTAATMASYVRDEHSEWLEGYISGKKDAFTAYQSLLRLLRRFAYRHGFVQRTPHVLKEKLQDLEAVQAEFARVFKAKYSGYCPSKLPLLFIVRGEPNGTIEREKLPTYPEDHVYTVQS